MPANPPPLDAAARDELARKGITPRGLDLDSETSEVPRFWRCMCCQFATADERHIHNHLDETGHGFVSDNEYARLLALLAAAQRGEEETRDAERYRFLLSQLYLDGDRAWPDEHLIRQYVTMGFLDVPLSFTGDDVGEAIDAARSTPTEGDETPATVAIVCLNCDRRVNAVLRPDIHGAECPHCGYENPIPKET